MEFILRDTDIFDKDIEEKFREIILNNKDAFTEGQEYKLEVRFGEITCYDPRIEEFDIQNKMCTDKISDVLSYQIDKIFNVLRENNIIIYNGTIQGDNLESENIIEIEIEINEDTSQPINLGKKKDKKRNTYIFIVPSLSYAKEAATDMVVDHACNLYKIYVKLMDEYGVSKKLMSEILGLEATEDDNKIIDAFVEQYGKLWFCTKNEKNELIPKLKKRALSVLEKHMQKNEK